MLLLLLLLLLCLLLLTLLLELLELLVTVRVVRGRTRRRVLRDGRHLPGPTLVRLGLVPDLNMHLGWFLRVNWVVVLRLLSGCECA